MAGTTQALMSRLKVQAAFDGRHQVRCDNTAKNIVVMSPAFRIHTEVGREGLPRDVRPGDDVGLLQTIFKNKGKAWYNLLGSPTSAAWSYWPNKRLKTLSQRTEAAVRQGAMQPYKLLRWKMPGLPACDRDDAHETFYDPPTTFEATFDRQKASLLGMKSASRSVINPELMDKPQQVFPIYTPCGKGKLHYLRAKFVATSWLAALRGTQVIHFFWYIDWQLEYEGRIFDDGSSNLEYDTTILSQGPGQGKNLPVIGGVAANDLQSQIQKNWSFLPSSFGYTSSGRPLGDELT
jgi:hypothetical protein